MCESIMSRKTIKEDQESRAYNWALLATLFLLISLIVQTPARVVGHFLPPSAKSLLTSWGGTVWSGQANTQYHSLQGQLRWTLDPLAFFRLGAGVKWELLTGDSHMTGRLVLRSGGWELRQVNGELSGRDLKAVMENWSFPSTPLVVQGLDLLRKSQGWQGSGGQVQWQGGNIEYFINGQKQALNLPPVVLTLSAEGERLKLELTEQQGGAGLATFVVNGGMLESRLRQRLLSHAADYRGVAEPDAVVVSASQPLSSL